MKEKIKNFFTNITLWEYIIGFFALIILLSVSYSRGFVDGVLIDDDIRTELIDTTLCETKKSKIEPKKANEIVKYSPFDTYEKYTKVYFWINEDIVYDFYNNITNVEYNMPYYIYINDDESIYFTITFIDEQSASEAFIFDLNINDTYLYFQYGQGQAFNFEFSDNLPIDDSMTYDEVLNYTGDYISDNKVLLGLDRYYFNNTTADFTYRENEDFTRLYVWTYDILEPKSFLSEFLSVAVQVVSGFGAVLTASVVGIGTIFYSNGQLTIVGSAMALALGIGAIYLLFRMIRGLIKQNNRG